MITTTTTTIIIVRFFGILKLHFVLASSDNNNNNNNNNLNINDQNFNVQSMGSANMGRKSSFHPVENLKCSIGKFGIEAADSSRNSNSSIISNIIRYELPRPPLSFILNTMF